MDVSPAQLGITSSREGLTSCQRVKLWQAMRHLRIQGAVVFHHGDCVGGDVEAAVFAEAMGYFTVAHPPVDDRLRAFHKSDLVLDVEDYHVRNRAIVDASTVMIGCPRESREQFRGGTWSTIRYARLKGCSLLVIGPSGSYLEQHLWQEISE